jgi:hypothetical protein
MTKKALLIGILYRNSSCELRGCINDIVQMREVLINKYGYESKNITMLTDDTPTLPTKYNILNELRKLVSNVQKGDQLCLYYSGHGTRVRDINYDEASGYDEAIYTIDNQLIIDDDILTAISDLNGAHITIFFDCCHSGTLADLAYNMKYGGRSILGKPRFEFWTEKSKEINGSACMFSGCLDTQTSADVQFRRSYNEYQSNGAFSMTLLSLLANDYKWTNKDIMQALYDNLQKQNYEQIPQFSCSCASLLDCPFTI